MRQTEREGKTGNEPLSLSLSPSEVSNRAWWAVSGCGGDKGSDRLANDGLRSAESAMSECVIGALPTRPIRLQLTAKGLTKKNVLEAYRNLSKLSGRSDQ